MKERIDKLTNQFKAKEKIIKKMQQAHRDDIKEIAHLKISNVKIVRSNDEKERDIEQLAQVATKIEKEYKQFQEGVLSKSMQIPSISQKGGISKPMENKKINEIEEMLSPDEIGSDAEVNISKLDESPKKKILLIDEECETNKMENVENKKKNELSEFKEAQEYIAKERLKFNTEKVEILRQMKDHQLRIQKLESDLTVARAEAKNTKEILNEDESSVKGKAVDLEKNLEILTTLYHQLASKTSTLRTEKEILDRKLNKKQKLCEEMETKLEITTKQLMEHIAILNEKEKVEPQLLRVSSIKKQTIKKVVLTGGKKAIPLIMQSMKADKNSGANPFGQLTMEEIKENANEGKFMTQSHVESINPNI